MLAPCPTDIIFRTVTSIPSIPLPKASVGILQHLMSVFPRRPRGAGPGQVPTSTDRRDDHNRGGLGHVGR